MRDSGGLAALLHLFGGLGQENQIEGELIMIDYKRLKKPAHVKEHIWRKHLQWMEVVGKQLEENLKKMSKQAGDRGSTGGTSSGNI
jgi:hypothetical protein